MTRPILLIIQVLDDQQVKSIKKYAKGYEVLYSPNQLPTCKIEDIEIIFGWDDKICAHILSFSTSKLKWIQSPSAGVDTLDLALFKEKGILLSNASGTHAKAITETVLGMILAHTRGIKQAIIEQQKKHWAKKEITYTNFEHLKILIVGTGSIGKNLGNVCSALGLEVYGINRSGYSLPNFIKNFPQTQIDTVLPNVDIVVNILPLTKETFHFYDDHRFNCMKDGSIFINVGRGASVCTEDLIHSLKNGKISFAGLDVFEEEPLPPTNELWSLENVIITPHISGQVQGFKQKITDIFLCNLTSYLSNYTLSQNEIDLTNGY